MATWLDLADRPGRFTQAGTVIDDGTEMIRYTR
jgi:hypothetical protein